MTSAQEGNVAGLAVKVLERADEAAGTGAFLLIRNRTSCGADFHGNMPVAGREPAGASQAVMISPAPPHSTDTKLAVLLAAALFIGRSRLWRCPASPTDVAVIRAGWLTDDVQVSPISSQQRITVQAAAG
jgi:hypothetical protein